MSNTACASNFLREEEGDEKCSQTKRRVESGGGDCRKVVRIEKGRAAEADNSNTTRKEGD